MVVRVNDDVFINAGAPYFFMHVLREFRFHLYAEPDICCGCQQRKIGIVFIKFDGNTSVWVTMNGCGDFIGPSVADNRNGDFAFGFIRQSDAVRHLIR